MKSCGNKWRTGKTQGSRGRAAVIRCSHTRASQKHSRELWTQSLGNIREFGLLFLLLALAVTPAACQDGATADAETGVLHGHVFDSTHHPIAEATVRIIATEGERSVEVRTDKSGAFILKVAPRGELNLFAEKSGEQSAPVSCKVSPNATQSLCDIILNSRKAPGQTGNAESGDQMEFADQPRFTVAGLTDWTAVGGHGTDSSVRTSEVLAREALSLPSNEKQSTVTLQGAQAMERTLRADLSAAPASINAKQRLGDFYVKAGRYAEAISLLRAVYDIEPSQRGVAYSLAEAYELDGQLTQADAILKTELAHSNDSQNHRLAAIVDEQLDNPLDAVHEYEIAVRLDPSEQNYFEWGSELLLHRAVSEAQQVLSRGTEVYPQSGRMLATLGSAFLASALYQQAANALCKASDLEPSVSDFYLFLGKTELASPTPLDCIESRLARFKQLEPNNALAYYFIAMDLSKRQEQNLSAEGQQQIEILLTKAVNLDPHCGDAYLQLGILSSSRRQWDKAVAFFQTAVRVDPQLSEAHYRLGLAYDRLHKPDQAKQEFQLHDEIEKQQVAAIEQDRRKIRQFRIVVPLPADKPSQ